jgi:HEAT repeat protein
VGGKFRSVLEEAVVRAPVELREQFRRNAELLSESGIKTYEALYAAPYDRGLGSDARLAACWALAYAGGCRAVSELLKALRHEEPEMSFEAAKSLVALGDTRALQQMISVMLKGRGPHNRAAASYALGMLGDARAVPSLIEVLDGDDEPLVRGHAAEALGNIGDRRALDSLVRNLSDDSPEVRFWSAYALGELGDPAALPHLKKLASKDTAAISNFGSVGSEARSATRRIRSKSSRHSL